VKRQNLKDAVTSSDVAAVFHAQVSATKKGQSTRVLSKFPLLNCSPTPFEVSLSSTSLKTAISEYKKPFYPLYIRQRKYYQPVDRWLIRSAKMTDEPV
jgi:hypothetical protein